MAAGLLAGLSPGGAAVLGAMAGSASYIAAPAALRIPLRKVTIIAERVLREELITLIKDRGASGWTLTMVEGEGSRGIRASEWEGRNVQIDTLVSSDVAEIIMDEVGAHYFKDRSVIVYVADVEVLRKDKYTG